MKVNFKLGHTAAILKACKKYGLLRNQAAYVLATAYWETGRTMLPVKEAYWLSESWRRKNLRYYPWYGRGYVQLTWETNYRRAGRKLGVDMVADKDLALDPDIAAEVLVLGSKEGWFTKHKLSDHITLRKSGFTQARRIINGMDKASTIAGIARKYDAALKRRGYGVSVTDANMPIETPKQPKQTRPATQDNPDFIDTLINLLRKVIAL
jgi:hypothetical protein